VIVIECFLSKHFKESNSSGLGSELRPREEAYEMRIQI